MRSSARWTRSPSSRCRPPSLVKGIRSPLVDDIANLRKLTANIQRNRGELDRALQVLPIKLEKVGRTAIYGSWFNFYLCQFQGKVKLPGRHGPRQLQHRLPEV